MVRVNGHPREETNLLRVLEAAAAAAAYLPCARPAFTWVADPRTLYTRSVFHCGLSGWRCWGLTLCACLAVRITAGRLESPQADGTTRPETRRQVCPAAPRALPPRVGERQRAKRTEGPHHSVRWVTARACNPCAHRGSGHWDRFLAGQLGEDRQIPEAAGGRGWRTDRPEAAPGPQPRGSD